jgi:hypothetical protein
MLNEVAYCPRLFALEWLNREWADSADTVEGRTVHRRVDAETRAGLPEPDDAGGPRVVRSVLLGDSTLGLVARIDLVEAEGGEVVPVDYKTTRRDRRRTCRRARGSRSASRSAPRASSSGPTGTGAIMG